MTDPSAARTPVGKAVEVLLPLLVLALLVALCVQLLVPFIGLLLWTIILAVCFFPLHQRLTWRGMSGRLAAIVIGIALAALILVPVAVAALSAASNIPDIAGLLRGEEHLRPPPARLQELPLVGAKLHAAWAQASADMPAFARQFGPQVAAFTKWLLALAGGMLAAVLALLLAVVFASIMLAYWQGAREMAAVILTRVAGDRARGEHYMAVIGATIRSVANGVIGVAFVQALLCGIGFFVLGIPGAGVLSLLAMALGVVQVPVVLVTLPAIIYAFSTQSTTGAILYTVWFIISGLSDAVLKPLMIGHGLEVPMPIILLGVIGGVMAYGLVGLFIGAVMLAVGWVLLLEWLGPASAGQTPTLQAAE